VPGSGARVRLLDVDKRVARVAVEVPSQSTPGAVYVVAYMTEPRAWDCECASFSWRERCHHIPAAQRWLREQAAGAEKGRAS
jgi:hypothetical protein